MSTRHQDDHDQALHVHHPWTAADSSWTPSPSPSPPQPPPPLASPPPTTTTTTKSCGRENDDSGTGTRTPLLDTTSTTAATITSKNGPEINQGEEVALTHVVSADGGGVGGDGGGSVGGGSVPHSTTTITSTASRPSNDKNNIMNKKLDDDQDKKKKDNLTHFFQRHGKNSHVDEDANVRQKEGQNDKDQNAVKQSGRNSQDEDGKVNNEMARKPPKIDLSKIFKFRPTINLHSYRRSEPRVEKFTESLVKEKDLNSDAYGRCDSNNVTQNLSISRNDDDKNEAKMLDFGLHKPRNEETDNDVEKQGRQVETSPMIRGRKTSQEENAVTFHLGSDTDSEEAEYATPTKGMSNGDSAAVTVENETETEKPPAGKDKEIDRDHDGRGDSKHLWNGRPTKDSDRNKTSNRNISRGSFTSRSSITLSKPKNKATDPPMCDNSIPEDGSKMSENNNNNFSTNTTTIINNNNNNSNNNDNNNNNDDKKTNKTNNSDNSTDSQHTSRTEGDGTTGVNNKQLLLTLTRNKSSSSSSRNDDDFNTITTTTTTTTNPNKNGFNNNDDDDNNTTTNFNNNTNNYDSLTNNGSFKSVNSNHSYHSNNNNNNTSDNVILQGGPGVLRKGSDRDMNIMSGGLRRYRRRSQMSITCEIPADVPSKQRRAECENRIRDNLDYIKRRVSVQEENNVVFDENGGVVRPFLRKSFSIDDERNRAGNGGGSGGDPVTVGYVTMQQQQQQQHPQYYHQQYLERQQQHQSPPPPQQQQQQQQQFYNNNNNTVLKHSASMSSMSPMSLSPTSSAIFDYGTTSTTTPMTALTSPTGRRSATCSISSVKWEDIVLSEANGSNNNNNNNNNIFDDSSSDANNAGYCYYNYTNDVEREGINDSIIYQNGYYPNATCSGTGGRGGFIYNGYLRDGEIANDYDDVVDVQTEKAQQQNYKRRHGSVVLPLNVIDLARQNQDDALGGGSSSSGSSRGIMTVGQGCGNTVVLASPAANGGGGNDGASATRSGVGGDFKSTNGINDAADDEDEEEEEDDPPPYVPMKRRPQAERPPKADLSAIRGADQPLPHNFRRHSSASVDSALSATSGGSAASILRQDSLAIFHKRPSGPIRRLSQISMTDLGNIRRKHMEMTKREWLHAYSLHIFVLLIFLVTVLSVSLAWYYRNLSIRMLQQTQRVFFDPRTRKLSLTDPTDHLTIEGYLGLDMPRWQLPLHCPLVVGQDPSMRSCEWKNNALLTIDHFGNDQVECYNVTWQSQHPLHVPYDCFHLEGHEWFGPSNNSDGVWPIRGNFSYSPSNQRVDHSGVYGSVVDHYWLSSWGVGLRVHGDDPVHIKWNQTVENSLCILSNYTGSLYDQNTPPMLKYTICNGLNAVQTHAFMQETFPPKYDVPFPPADVFRGLYWSAKGIMGRKHNVTQNDIVNLAIGVSNFSSPSTASSSSSASPSSSSSSSSVAASVLSVSSSFSLGSPSSSTISLDTDWQAEEGDLTFDPAHFPNITDMLSDLEEIGSRLILSVSPHVSFKSKSFQKGIESDFFVHDASGAVTGLVEYEGGVASILDVTKSDVSHWFNEKLKTLVAPDAISSLRLTYGPFPWLPYRPHFGVPSASPNSQRQKLVEIVSELCEAPIIEHTGSARHLTQLIPVPSKIRHDTASDRKCIHSPIETALTLGVMGHPFIMADGLEGGTQTIGTEDIPGIPDRELYIRWLQVASFFPALQLTTAPWQYDAEVVAIASNYSLLRETSVLPLLQAPSLREEVADGMPLLRPVWWMDPANQELEGFKFKIDDEFIIGDSLLIAPVLCKGVRSRNIYVPSGVWEDLRQSKVIIGPNMLRNYPVPLHEIALFKRRETVM